VANLYVDGGTPVSAAHTGNDFVLTSQVRLGRPYAYQSFYTGLIDDVRVYDYVLSPEEIAIIMRGNVSLAWNPKPLTGQNRISMMSGPLAGRREMLRLSMMFTSALIKTRWTMPTRQRRIYIEANKVRPAILPPKVLNGARSTTGELTSLTQTGQSAKAGFGALR